MVRWTQILLLGYFVAACVALGGSIGCRKNQPTSKAPSNIPTIRIYAISTLAGALEPCGCVKDMLGGVDHAAALIDKGKTEAPHALVLGAGPLLFMNPELSPEKKTQDLWKAESIANALFDMGLVAWAPGVNDLADGAATLKDLRGRTQASLLAANLTLPNVELVPTRTVDVAGYKVGIAGVSLISLPGAQVSDAKAALLQAATELGKSGAQIKVALIAAPRGDAMRLVEATSGFNVFVVGKPSDAGESNDAPIPPVVVNDALVVQAPNHLQAVAVVDLFVRDDSLRFQDGSGIELSERRDSLTSRIRELEQRLGQAEASVGVNPADLEARRADLGRLRADLTKINEPVPPKSGSFFRYELRQVRENLGVNANVAARLSDYYKRVNDHNREAFKDLTPAEPAKGEPRFVGIEQCSDCHEEAEAFWHTTGHAKAYKTLSDEFKEFNLDCVGCHVTGYEQPGGSTVTHVEGLKDVQCEVCHGAGSQHIRDPEKADMITLTPREDVCTKCHHPPHVKEDWSVKEAWEHIIGPGHGQPLVQVAPKP